MVDPIGRRITPLQWSESSYATATALAPSKDDFRSAQAQVTALNYKVDTIESLAPPAPKEIPKKSEAIENTKEKKSFLRRVGDWFWGLWGKKEDPANAVVDAVGSIGSSIAKVGASEDDGQRKLTKTILELNRELNQRIKESSEFEEEMRKSGSNQLDRFFFVHLVKFSLEHKAHKETASTLVHENLMTKHEKNKHLHHLFYNLREEIADRAKSAKILKWINVGTTGGIVAAVAATFATGGIGGIFSFALPLLSLGKGGFTIAQGRLSYKNEVDTGKLTMVSHESKRNSLHIEDDLETMQLHDGDIKTIMEAIRKNLDHNSDTARLFAQDIKKS